MTRLLTGILHTVVILCDIMEQSLAGFSLFISKTNILIFKYFFFFVLHLCTVLYCLSRKYAFIYTFLILYPATAVIFYTVICYISLSQ